MSLYTPPPCRLCHALLKGSLLDLQVGAQVINQEAHTEFPVGFTGLWLMYECTVKHLATLSGSEIRLDQVSEHKKKWFSTEIHCKATECHSDFRCYTKNFSTKSLFLIAQVQVVRIILHIISSASSCTLHTAMKFYETIKEGMTFDAPTGN